MRLKAVLFYRTLTLFKDIFIIMITKKELIRKGFNTSRLVSEQKEGKKDEFAEMISLLLHSRTQAHTLHLQTDSFSEHMALNGYYDGIGDLVDGLVESFKGKYGIISGYKSYNIETYKSTESKLLPNHEVPAVTIDSG